MMENPFIGKVSAVILMAIILASCTARYYTGERSYLQQNNETISLPDDQEIDILGRFSDADVFFLGEIHGVSENQQVALSVLKNLNMNCGLNNFIAELGYSSGWMIRRFIETGDEEMLESVLDYSVGTYFGTLDSERFIRSLRDYNLSVEEAGRIRYTGIDIEHQPQAGLIHLSDIDARTALPAPDALQSLLDDIPDLLAAEDISRPVLYKTCIAGLWADYSANSEQYISWCPPDTAEELELTIQSLYYGLYWYVEEGCRTIRDPYIYENFKIVYVPGEKYAGLWGYNHTPTTDIEAGRSFIASMIGTECCSTVSFLILYFDSSGYNPRHPSEPFAVDSAPLVTNRFHAVNQEGAVFFDLRAPGSPFLTSDNLGFSNIRTNCAADYYQACILLNGATAAGVYVRQ